MKEYSQLKSYTRKGNLDAYWTNVSAKRYEESGAYDVVLMKYGLPERQKLWVLPGTNCADQEV